MASRWLTIALLLSPALALDNNFAFYPKGAQSCLNKAADDASCTGQDSKELNYCLCGLGSYKNDFILGSARCVGEESPNDVDETYDTMSKACDQSSTPMKVTKEEFQDAAKEGYATTTTDAAASTTATATGTDASTAASTASATTTESTAAATTSADSKTEDTGLSTGATAGIGIGAAVGGAAVLGLFVWLWMHRRKKNHEESHPMLPNYENGSPSPHNEAKAGWSAAGTPHPAWGSPDPNAGFYTPQKPNYGPAELHPDTVAAPNPVYEMDGTTSAPIEMPGSLPVEYAPVSPRTLPGSSHGAPTTPQTLPVSPMMRHGDANGP
ncbi:c2h2 type zinc finger containing protein [Fusarium heterosporum]|uniref:C2h2 type zinc finger containing protein n=1 Tax=Fusarium heterosporum TaxID=42747 RepID=A0A8H5T7D1_FUSHE|nr:c2h2 type zinc finger containing protein [Fusarium heterosporum]